MTYRNMSPFLSLKYLFYFMYFLCCICICLGPWNTWRWRWIWFNVCFFFSDCSTLNQTRNKGKILKTYYSAVSAFTDFHCMYLFSFAFTETQHPCCCNTTPHVPLPTAAGYDLICSGLGVPVLMRDRSYSVWFDWSEILGSVGLFSKQILPTPV